MKRAGPEEKSALVIPVDSLDILQRNVDSPLLVMDAEEWDILQGNVSKDTGAEEVCKEGEGTSEEEGFSKEDQG